MRTPFSQEHSINRSQSYYRTGFFAVVSTVDLFGAVQGFGVGIPPYWQGYASIEDVQEFVPDGMGGSRAYITTPKVIEVARAHFACPTLPGGETESAGGVGSGGGGTELSSHWDSRLYAVRCFSTLSSLVAAAVAWCHDKESSTPEIFLLISKNI